MQTTITASQYNQIHFFILVSPQFFSFRAALELQRQKGFVQSRQQEQDIRFESEKSTFGRTFHRARVVPSSDPSDPSPCRYSSAARKRILFIVPCELFARSPQL